MRIRGTSLTGRQQAHIIHLRLPQWRWLLGAFIWSENQSDSLLLTFGLEKEEFA
jgi:hypothetical protein